MTARRLLAILLILISLAVIAAIVVGIRQGELLSEFGDSGFLTIVSAVLLISGGVIALKLFGVRRADETTRLRKSPSFVWLIVGISLIALAADDKFKLHESLDHRVHDILQMKQTPLTDRIDDVIIAIYVIIALTLVYIYRDELKRYTGASRYVAAGFGVTILMVILDVITNGPELIELVFEDLTAETVQSRLSVLEEFCKLAAGSFFVTGLYAALLQTRNETLSQLSHE